MLQPVATDKAPAAIGPYSQGIACGGFVFASGQLPIDPATGEMPSDVSAQARQSLTNLKAILEAAGAGMDSVVKVTIFLQDIADFAKVNEVYSTFFTQPYPARSCFAVAAIPKGARIEIEAIAAKK